MNLGGRRRTFGAIDIRGIYVEREQMKNAMCAAAIAALVSTPAFAAEFFNAQVTPTKDGANNEYIASGGSLFSQGFNIVTNETTDDQVALRARNRGQFGNGDVAVSGDQYTINPDNGTSNSIFQFEFQFTPGSTNMGDYANYFLRIAFDSDPSAGVDYSSSTLTLPIFGTGVSWDDGDGYFTTDDGGRAGGTSNSRNEWSDGSIPFVYSQSWRPEFIPGYTGRPGPGQYNLEFSAFNGDPAGSGTLVALADISVTVIPEPLTFLGGGSLLGILGMRRKRSIA